MALLNVAINSAPFSAGPKKREKEKTEFGLPAKSVISMHVAVPRSQADVCDLTGKRNMIVRMAGLAIAFPTIPSSHGQPRLV
jgi:hypothetical protein